MDSERTNLFKCDTEENIGENWPIADFGGDEEGVVQILTTDDIHASEVGELGDAKQQCQVVCEGRSTWGTVCPISHLIVSPELQEVFVEEIYDRAFDLRQKIQAKEEEVLEMEKEIRGLNQELAEQLCPYQVGEGITVNIRGTGIRKARVQSIRWSYTDWVIEIWLHGMVLWVSKESIVPTPAKEEGT